MITKNINGHVVKVYDSIEELPIINFQKYNKFMLIDSVIGGDVADIDVSVLKVLKYIQQGDTDMAVKQLDNMRNAMHLVAQEISPKYLAFTALLAEIDGKPITDVSDSNLMSILEVLNTERKYFIDAILLQFKKKIDVELGTYFPKSQNSAYTKELYSKLKDRVILELDGILKDICDYEAIDRIDTDLLLSSKPKVFSGPDSFEIKNDKQFNDLCLTISKSLNVDVKKLTVFEFYNAIDYIEKNSK